MSSLTDHCAPLKYITVRSPSMVAKSDSTMYLSQRHNPQIECPVHLHGREQYTSASSMQSPGLPDSRDAQFGAAELLCPVLTSRLDGLDYRAGKLHGSQDPQQRGVDDASLLLWRA